MFHAKGIIQGFPNSEKKFGGRGGKSSPPVRGIGKFCWGGFFYRMVRTWGGVILTILTFFKAKTPFCEYWTSIKIKISMTCVSEEQWGQLKMAFFIGLHVTAYLQWVEYQTNLLNAWNSISYHQEIATIN